MKVQTRIKCIEGSPYTLWVAQVKILFWWRDIVNDKKFANDEYPKGNRCRKLKHAEDVRDTYLWRLSLKKKKTKRPVAVPKVTYQFLRTHDI